MLWCVTKNKNNGQYCWRVDGNLGNQVPKRELAFYSANLLCLVGAVFLIARIGNRPFVPSTDEWIMNVWNIYPHGILLRSYKYKNRNLQVTGY